MTFEEAIELKSMYHEKFVNDEGYEPTLTIAPRRGVEYRKWLLD